MFAGWLISQIGIIPWPDLSANYFFSWGYPNVKVFFYRPKTLLNCNLQETENIMPKL
jgi:hypothetical protein